MILRDDVIAWIRAYAAAIADQKDHLTRLDADIGDGDHGSNMDRGFQAVLGKLPDVGDKDIGAIFKTVGMTLVSTVGGASGPLYGTLFLQMGSRRQRQAGTVPGRLGRGPAGRRRRGGHARQGRSGRQDHGRHPGPGPGRR